MTQLRIGQPPSLPPRARRRWPLYAIGGVLAAALAAGAGVAGILVARGDNKPEAAATPTGSPIDALSERHTCLAALPLLSRGATEMTAIYNDPARSVEDISLTAAALRAMEARAPESLRPDIAAQRQILQQVADAKGDPGRLVAVDEEAYEASGLRLTSLCRPHVVVD